MKRKFLLTLLVVLCFLSSLAMGINVYAAVTPMVRDANISISGATGTGGAYKIGDTVTAMWNNTAGGDNNIGISGVTVDFSQFGGGSWVAATNSSEMWTATYTITSGAIDGINRNVAVTATNIEGNTTTADTTNATVDNVAPMVTDARISISGASGTGGAYKIGDTVTATWNNTAGGDNNSDTISSVTVDFTQFGGGAAVTATNSAGTWTATYTIVSGAIDGTSRNVSVTATDNAGNSMTTADTTNATLDNIAPTVTNANISISGASGTGGAYKRGDTVTATWNNTAGGDNNSDTISGVTVDFTQFGGGAAVTATNSAGTWTATYTIVSGAIDGTSRNVSVTATDNAGNSMTTADTTNATLDNIAPTVTDARISISGASGTGGAYKIGDTVTATWNNTAGGDNNSDTISGVTVDFSQFGGGAAVAAANSAGTWTATCTIVSGAIDGSYRNVSVTATDNAGNTTTTADTSNATVDSVAPIVTNSSISISGASGTGGSYKIGDTVTATWNNTAVGDDNSDTISGVTVDFSQFGGGAAVAATNSSGTWTATYTIVSGAIDGTNRNVSLTAKDNAGNTTTTADTSNATVDNAAPTVTDAKISISGASGTGGAFTTGDTVTATWNNTAGGDNNSDTISVVTVDFSQFGGGAAVAATNSAGMWTATCTITVALDGLNRNVSVTATDNAGNSTTADITNATVDNTAPTVTDGNITISGASGAGGAYKIGDTVAATWDNTAGGDNNSDTISSVTVDFSQFGGGAAVAATNSAETWTATYTIVSGAIDGTNRNVSVTATDNAGNSATTADTTNATVDNIAPTVTDANISISGASGTGGAFTTGDTVTATWNNTAGGDNNSDTISVVTVDFSQFEGGAAVAATNSAGMWTATCTITVALDGLNRNVSVTATDNAGNSTTADITNATVDNTAPTVTDGNITISGASGTGGAYKIGDTVTATWDNTAGGDNNGDTISSVTVDFSQFGGGAAVAAANSAGTWTATCTIVSGAIDGINRNVSVTATDNAGNNTTTADTTNATVDNIAPAIVIVAATAGGDALVNVEEKAAGFDVVAQSSEATGTLYVVPSGTANNIGAITGADIGSAVSAGADTDTTISISANNAGLTDGAAFSVYAVDYAGNVSLISEVAFTADLSLPAITSGTLAASNSYIDIVFNKGIYGANDGTTALSAAKLALTFTQNAGSATNASISSVRQNDSVTEGSASVLAGGETAVRVFLTITGNPINVETIEIKPANETSVYDKAGNPMDAGQTTGDKTLNDNTPPDTIDDAPATTPSPTPTPAPAPAPDESVKIIVNGNEENAATLQTSKIDGKTVTTVTLNDTIISEKMGSEDGNSTVVITVNNKSDVVVGTLNGQTVKNMETREATLEIRTENVTYTLPASEININDVSSQLGEEIGLEDIKVNISIAAPSGDTVKIVEDTANKNNYQLVVKPVEFSITCTSGDKTVEISKFNGYVERTVAIPDGIDPSKITTGIVLNADGTFSHVPTTIIIIDGKYHAKISSLTNSTYSVIWNPKTYSDIEKHWAKGYIENLASRLIVKGIDDKLFDPEKAITRGEFAASIIRGLGLAGTGNGEDTFTDVKSTSSYYDIIKTAYDYKIVLGNGNGTFQPDRTITREEAMLILVRAMKIAGLNTGISETDMKAVLSKYKDGNEVHSWSQNEIAVCIREGILEGSNNMLFLKDNITMAQTAAVIERVLKKAKLI